MAIIVGHNHYFTFTEYRGSWELPGLPAYMEIVDVPDSEAPTTITAILGDFEPFAEVTFTIEGEVVGTADVDLDGEANGVTVEVPASVSSGIHILTATSNARTATAMFGLARDPRPLPVEVDPDVAPFYVPGSERKWVMQDPNGLGSWVLPISPTSMSNPHVRKSVSSQRALAGRPHLYEGAAPIEWQFAGFCPDRDFYSRMVAYAELRRRFYVIDHRGRAWTVSITALSMKPRKRTLDDHGVANDWMADYDVRLALYDQQPLVPVAP